MPHPAAAEVLKSQLAALDGNAHLTPCLAAGEGVAQGNPGAGTVLMFATLPPTAQDPPSSRANSAQLDNSTVLTDAVGNTTTGGRGSYAQLVRDRELHRQPIQKQIRQGGNVSQAGKRGSRGATIDDLHMTAGLASAFRSLGILTAPTPVQIRAISACRACSDFICDMRSSEQRIQVIAALLAETAWAAPLGETVAIMLTPSKVVAKQTVKILDDALALGLSSTTAGGVQGAAVAQLVGSKGMTGQATALRSARVAVGTFQRAAMFVTSGALRAEHLRLVILDDPSILEHESNAPLVNAVETVKNWLPAKRKIVAFGEAFSQRAVDRLRVWMGPFQRVDLQEGGRDGPERGTKRSGVHGQRNPQKRRRGGGGA